MSEQGAALTQMKKAESLKENSLVQAVVAVRQHRRPGFNEQNKILPLLVERGEGRGEESSSPVLKPPPFLFPAFGNANLSRAKQ